MESFKHYLQSKGHSQRGIQVHERHLYYFLNWCEDENIEAEQATYSELLSYIKSYRGRIQQATIYKYLNSLQHYYNWLIQQEIREENPTTNIDIKGIKRRSLYHILSKQDLESLYHHYPSETTADKRNKVILGLMIYQGLDTAALKNLTEKDLKLREGKIHVAGSRKSNERTLKLEAHQVLDLMEYTLQVRQMILKETGKETEKLIVSTGTGEKIDNLMQRLMQKLHKQNNQVTSTKQIRTSVITHWLKQYNLREVQYRAGHRYVSSTEAYLINDLDDLTEEITKYHPIG